MESLRAELALAKEQARRSDAAASSAAEELKAERAAHCLSRAEVAELAMKVKDAADRNEALEKERLSERDDLKKATAEAKDARSAMRAMKGGTAPGRRYRGWQAFSATSPVYGWKVCSI